jgi:predicted protein tyrosine phosphatase
MIQAQCLIAPPVLYLRLGTIVYEYGMFQTFSQVTKKPDSDSNNLNIAKVNVLPKSALAWLTVVVKRSKAENHQPAHGLSFSFWLANARIICLILDDFLHVHWRKCEYGRRLLF